MKPFAKALLMFGISAAIVTYFQSFSFVWP